MTNNPNPNCKKCGGGGHVPVGGTSMEPVLAPCGCTKTKEATSGRHRVTFWNHATRVYQVYDADRVCVGSWSARGLQNALVALAQHPFGRMVICDERLGRGVKFWGWVDRVVVEEIAGAGCRAA